MKNAKATSSMSTRARTTYRVGLMVFVSTLLSVPFYAYIAFQEGIWQLFVVAGAVGGMGLAFALSLQVLVRRERVELGIAWMVASTCLTSIIISTVIADIGLTLGLLSVLATVAIATQALSASRATQVIMISVLAALLDGLLAFLEPATQHVVAGIKDFLVGISVALFAALAFVLARQFKNFSLRTKLILAFFVVAATPVLILGFLTDRSTRDALSNEAGRVLLAGASQTSAALDTFMLNNLSDLRVEAQSPRLVAYMELPAAQRASNELRQEMLAGLHLFSSKYEKNIASYALLDQQGLNVLDTFAADVGRDESGTDYFRSVTSSAASYISPVEFSRTSGEPSLTFSNPIRNAGGDLIGVLRVRFDANILQELVVTSNALVAEGAFAIVLDENHVRLAHATQPELRFKSVVPLDAADLQQLQSEGRLPPFDSAQLSTDDSQFEQGLQQAGGSSFFTANLGPATSEVYSAAVLTLKTQPWFVVYAQPQSVFLQASAEQARFTLLLAVVVSGVVVASAFFVSQFLAGPITRLTDIAERVGRGDLTAQVVVESTDEIGALATTFNTMTERLRETLENLEQRVTVRTRDLALAASIGRRISALRDPEVLLPESAEIIRSSFNLYYCAIYLIDASRNRLVLQAGSGEAGQQLMRRSHRVRIGTDSLPGYAAAAKQAVVAQNVREHPYYAPHPLLPDTRSVITVPLLIGDHELGVLELQSDQEGMLSEENLPSFSTIAAQLAIAIENARLFRESAQAHAEIEAHARRLAESGWRDLLNAVDLSERIGYRYHQTQITRLEDDLSDVLAPGVVSTPIKVAGHTVGMLQLQDATERVWAKEELDLLNAVSAQIAQQAESIRLLTNAERYRARAEDVTRRLTREGWQEILKTNPELSYSLIYDSDVVKSLPEGEDIQTLSAEVLTQPLKVHGEQVGDLLIEVENPSRDLRDLVTVVARQLSDYIENLRLSEQTRTTLSEMDILYSASHEMIQASNPAEVLNAMSSYAQDLGADNGQLLFIELDEHGNPEWATSMAEWQRQGTVSAPGARYYLPQFPFSQMWISHPDSAQLVSDVLTSDVVDPISREAFVQFGFRSTALLPLTIQSRWVGLVSFNWHEPHTFNERDQRLMQAIAQQAATVVDSTRAFQQARQRARHEQTLREISSRVHNAVDAEQILRTAAQDIGRALNRQTFIYLGHAKETLMPEATLEQAVPDRVKE